jgi:trans-aconitate 2-methyltransferase
VSAGYTWDADDYARNSSAQQGWARELIGKLELTGSESILDIGCGDGKVTAELASRVPKGEVVGIDSSPSMVERARASFPPDRFPTLSFSVMDARALAFRGRFRVVFSNATLHWVREQEAVLQGVARSLAPGGRLLFQMGGRGNAAGILSAITVLTAREPWAGIFAGFPFPYTFASPEQYARWLRAAGLLPVRVELLPRTMRHAGREGLAGWVRTTWMPYTERVPPELRERFVEELLDAYLAAHPAGADGAMEVAMVRLEVEARLPGA